VLVAALSDKTARYDRRRRYRDATRSPQDVTRASRDGPRSQTELQRAPDHGSQCARTGARAGLRENLGGVGSELSRSIWSSGPYSTRAKIWCCFLLRRPGV